MGIDSAEAHGADAGAQRAILRPQFSLPEHTQRRSAAAEVWVWAHTAGCGRQHLSVHSHSGLDQAGDPGSRLSVAYIGLNRADGRRRRVRICLAARAGQHMQLGSVADGGPRAVALTIGRGVNTEPGAAIGAANGLDLALRLGPGDASRTVR